MGCYFMDPKVLSFIPKNKPYLMDDVIKKVTNRKKFFNSFITKNGFIDIGKSAYKKTCQVYIERRGKFRKLK